MRDLEWWMSVRDQMNSGRRRPHGRFGWTFRRRKYVTYGRRQQLIINARTDRWVRKYGPLGG